MAPLLLAVLLQADPPAPSEKVLLEWIAELSSDDIERRSEASRKLYEAGDPALPYLESALKGAAPELEARCRALIKQMIYVEPGAREQAEVGITAPVMQCNAERKKEFEQLVSAGKLEDLLKKDYEWLTYAFDGILSDRKAIAIGSLRFVHRMIRKRGIPGDHSELAKENPDFRGFRSAASRGDEYAYWAQWWFTQQARKQVSQWADADAEDWEEALKALRGGWEARDAAKRFGSVKACGKSAYPYLVPFLDHKDTELGNSALTLLRALTGREGKDRVTEEDKASIKAEWETWLKSGQ